MNEIHPTAIVGPDVRLGHNNTVGPYAILDGEIVIGNRNSIGPHVVAYGPCTIGDDNLIEAHVVINTTSAIRDHLERGTTIGSRNVLKEFVSIGGRASAVGDDCFLMDKAHVAHNCSVGNFVTMASSAILGGLTYQLSLVLLPGWVRGSRLTVTLPNPTLFRGTISWTWTICQNGVHPIRT